MSTDRQSMVLGEGSVIASKYRLMREIGRGGMGVVYEAEHVTIGRRFAVKCLHRRYVDDARAISRFQQEAKLAGTVGHDNICEVIDFGTTEDGIPYLVMPLLVGASLNTLFQNEIISLERLLDIARQTLSALDAAYQANIVHRDLKPDNIFITKVGDRSDFVKLLDFGISKVLDPGTLMRLTRTGDIVGTPEYMSPEQAAGSEEIDQRADLWALGVILYEGLTGRCPFEGGSYNEIIVHIVNNAFPVPRALNPSVPSAVERVVLKALSRDPEARYRTPLEMDAALASALREMTPLGISSPGLPSKTHFGDNRLFAPSVRVSTPDIKPLAATTGAAGRFSQQKKRSSRRKWGIAAALTLGGLLLIVLIQKFFPHAEPAKKASLPIYPGIAVQAATQPPAPSSTKEALLVQDAKAPPLPNTDDAPTAAPEKIAAPPSATAIKSAGESKNPVMRGKRPPLKPVNAEPTSVPTPTPTSLPEKDTDKGNLIKRGITFEASYD